MTRDYIIRRDTSRNFFVQLRTLVLHASLVLAVCHFFAATAFAAIPLLTFQETELQGDQSNNQQNLGQAATEVIPTSDDFLGLQRKIREIDNEINSLFVNMPIGFPRLQQEHMTKIEQLKEVQADLRRRLDQAAIASFRADPQKNFQAARHIGRMLVAKLEGKAIGKAYDPAKAMELAELLIDNSDFDPQLHVMAYSAAIAVQDFDRATTHLEKLAEIGQMIEPELFTKLDEIKQNWKSELEIRELETQANDLPIVRLEMPEGIIEIELFENQAPETVANFISLVGGGFYDGRRFFQVRPGQIARAGCPNDSGNGNPGYEIPKESIKSPRKFYSGTIGMFSGADGIAGSQFFIAYGPPTGSGANFERFIAFGRITEGIDVLYALDRAEPLSELVSPPEKNQILKAEVVRKRDHEYQFKKIEVPILPIDNMNQLLGTGNDQSALRDVSPPAKKDQ